MTVFNTAYDTTVGKGFPTIKIISALEEAVIKNSFHTGMNVFTNSLDDSTGGYLMSNQFPEFSDVPYFTHPVLLDLKKINKDQLQYEKLFVTDVRSFAIVDHKDFHGNFIVRNKMEFDLAKIRTALNIVWVADSPLRLRDLSFVPASIYSSWISEAVSRRFALDPKDQLMLSILSCIFYYSLFIEQDKFEDTEKMRIVGAVSKATKASMKDVSDVIEQIESLNGIKDFVKTVKAVLQNTRLDDFNEGILVSVLNTSWFGTNAKEMLSVAIEHPPTWLAIVYSSFVERSFRNSAIAKISERYALNKGQNDFVRSIVSTVKSYLADDQ